MKMTLITLVLVAESLAAIPAGAGDLQESRSGSVQNGLRTIAEEGPAAQEKAFTKGNGGASGSPVVQEVREGIVRQQVSLEKVADNASERPGGVAVPPAPSNRGGVDGESTQKNGSDSAMWIPLVFYGVVIALSVAGGLAVGGPAGAVVGCSIFVGSLVLASIVGHYSSQ